MNKSDWMVTSNSINGKTVYGVYRLKDISTVDHSGNRENYGDYYEDRESAEKLAKQLNEEDVHGQE